MENFKKKIFVSYRFSGEDINVLKVVMDKITNTISEKGYDFFCSLYKEDYFEEQRFSLEQRYDYCNQNVIDSDVIFFFIKTADKSGGMEIELNQAIKHEKKIILAINESLDFTVFRENAHSIIEYKGLEQFHEVLSQYDFEI